MAVQAFPIRAGALDLRAAFVAVRHEAAHAAIVLGDALTWTHRAEIATHAAAGRLPTMWESGSFLDAGGLMAYGPDILDNFRRAAGYIDKILKGAKPADLPIELPTRLELVIDQKTARSLGLVIPASLVLRADRILD